MCDIREPGFSVYTTRDEDRSIIPVYIGIYIPSICQYSSTIQVKKHKKKEFVNLLETTRGQGIRGYQVRTGQDDTLYL